MSTRNLLIPVKWFRLPILLIVFLNLCANRSFSQSTWVGGPLPADTFASNPASWSPVGVPGPTTNVIVPNGAAPLFIDLNVTWASLTMTGGTLPTRMSIGAGIVHGISGNVTIESSSLPRNIFVFGDYNCASNIIGQTNTSLLGNRITVFSGGNLTASGNVSGCNLVMTGSAQATFRGNLTGGTVNAGFNGLSPTIDFQGSSAQSVPSGIYGNIVFSAGGVKTLAGPITITSEARFNNGIVVNSASSLIFFDGLFGGSPSVNNASDLSFATGPVRWLRLLSSGSFTFPVGKQGAGYHPASVDPLFLSNTDFTVEYIRSSASALGPIIAPGIRTVSNCEYWNISRFAGFSADVTLTWNSFSDCGGTYITDPPSLRVVHFNGLNWDLAGIAGGTGAATDGSVSWLAATDFSPFTIGSTSLLNPLPVGLTNFSAGQCGINICLNWKTSSENNNDHFEIERSADGRQFNQIGNVNGHGTTSLAQNYAFSDVHPLNAKSYYRLKQVDRDGKFTYSPIVEVNNANATSFIASLAPNPARSEVTLKIEGALKNENLLFEIRSVDGKTVYRENIIAERGTMVKNIHRPAVSNGLYFYKITRSSNNESFTGRLVFQ